MSTFLEIFIITILALACIGWLAEQRATSKSSGVTPGAFASTWRHQVREPGRKRPHLFSNRDLDHPLSRAHSHPSLLQLSADYVVRSTSMRSRVAVT